MPIAPSAGMALLGDWVHFWMIALLLFGGATAVFALLERAQASRNWLQDWDPRRLPRVAVHAATSPRLQALGELTANIVFLGWLFWLRYFSYQLFGSMAGNLHFNPDWRFYFLPVVLLRLAVMAQECVTLFRPQRTWLRPLTQLVINALGIVVVASMLRMEPFLQLTGTAAEMARYAKGVQIANICILWGLRGTLLALAIAFIVYLQRLLRLRSSLAAGSSDAVSLQLL